MLGSALALRMQSRSATPMRIRLATAFAVLALSGHATPAAASVDYLHHLSSTNGKLPLDAMRLSYDAAHAEVWVVSGGVARVFNSSGMELYSFGHNPELGTPQAVVGLEDGDLAVVAVTDGEWRLVRCNFRGEPKGRIQLSGVPEGFLDGFQPTKLIFAGGKLHVVSFTAMKVLVVDPSGAMVAAHDLAKLTDNESLRADLGLGGFSVDRDGSFLFTIPTQFTAFIVTPSGEVKAFGQKGSAPGKFQVVAGIGRDAAGNVFVADVLKSTVIMFDPALNFVEEFGFRGRKPSNLVGPHEMVVADSRIYVGQRALRGVSVFEVKTDPVAAAGARASETVIQQ
jgi:hypothetical protein